MSDTAVFRNLTPNIEEAKRFFRYIAETIAGPSEPACAPEMSNVTFQTFSDRKELKTNGKDPNAAILHGLTENTLKALHQRQARGAGVYWMVNPGDGQGRTAKNVTGTRAGFVDLDGSPLAPIEAAALKPHIVVESSPDRFHAYYITTGMTPDQFTPLQKALAAKFNGDKSVNDLPRVMRVPGFYHMKKDPFQTRIISLNDAPPYTVQELVEGLRLEIVTGPVTGQGGDDPVHGSTEGGRTEKLVKVASSFLYKGMPPEEVIPICSAWDATTNRPPLEETHPGKVAHTVNDIFQRYHEGKTATPSSPVTWGEPVPLPEGLAPVMPLQFEMIPEPLRPWLADISDRMQAPPDFSAAAAVVALGSTIGRGCGIRPKRLDDWLIVPNLWGGVVGRPSMMKTPAVAEAHRHLSRLEAEARAAHQADMSDHVFQENLNKVGRETVNGDIKKAIKGGATDFESFRDKMATLIMDTPTRRRFMTQDGTTEKIGELLVENPRGFIVNRDELSGWLQGLDKNGREQDRSFYLEAWNGKGAFTYDRIGRGTLDIPALCLSLFGCITPGGLSDYVASTIRGGRGDDGLLQRFQVMVWPDVTGEWKNVDRWPDTPAKQRAWDIFTRLSDDIPGAEIVEGESVPLLRYTPDGQAVFDEWRGELETKARTDMHPALESHIVKYRKLMPALSLIFHLVNVADGATPGPVSEDAAIMAAAWCQYLESHAGRVYGSALAHEMDAARSLLKRILRGDVKSSMTLREIRLKGWSRLDTPDAVRGALEVLEVHHWACIGVADKNPAGGRPSEYVQLNPKINR